MSKNRFNRILVTGGAGFIGSAFVRLILERVEKVVVLDLLTYAAHFNNLLSCLNHPEMEFIRGNILNGSLVEELVRKYEIDALVHFAAETHVDNSIAQPLAFYRTNVEGTLSLLEVVRRLPHIHFHHVSTDEVYGSIAKGQVKENAPYAPNSPYAASKAAADHFVCAYAKTYNLQVTLSYGSNTYGPAQHKEKFIPRMIDGCLNKKRLPLYGKGLNVRDWIYVDDHVAAIWAILQGAKKERGIVSSYNVAGGCEMRNIDLLEILIKRFAYRNNQKAETYRKKIEFVKDRPGHDFRYALSTKKIHNTFGWEPKLSFSEGIAQTIEWYILNG